MNIPTTRETLHRQMGLLVNGAVHMDIALFL